MKTIFKIIIVGVILTVIIKPLFSQEFIENYQWYFKIQKIGEINEKKWNEAYHAEMSNNTGEDYSNYKMLSIDVFPYEKMIVDKNQFADSLLNRFLYNTSGNPNGYSLIKKEEITVNGIKGLKGRFQLVGENATIKMLSLILPTLKSCYQIFLISQSNSVSFEELDKIINTFEFKPPVSLEAEKKAQLEKLKTEYLKSKKYFVNKDDFYQVIFPKAFDTLVFNSTVGEMKNMKQTCISSSIESGTFFGVYVDELPLSDVSKSDEEIIDLFKQHEINLNKSFQSTCNNIEHKGFKGFELKKVETNKFPPQVYYFRYYLAGHKMYMLMVSDLYNNLPQEMITYFFDSFSFTDTDELKARKDKIKETMDVRMKMRNMSPEERKLEMEKLRKKKG